MLENSKGRRVPNCQLLSCPSSNSVNMKWVRFEANEARGKSRRLRWQSPILEERRVVGPGLGGPHRVGGALGVSRYAGPHQLLNLFIPFRSCSGATSATASTDTERSLKLWEPLAGEGTRKKLPCRWLLDTVSTARRRAGRRRGNRGNEDTNVRTSRVRTRQAFTCQPA